MPNLPKVASLATKKGADFDPFDGPFTYREDWSLTMVLTVHRDFIHRH